MKTISVQNNDKNNLSMMLKYYLIDKLSMLLKLLSKLQRLNYRNLSNAEEKKIKTILKINIHIINIYVYKFIKNLNIVINKHK